MSDRQICPTLNLIGRNAQSAKQFGLMVNTYGEELETHQKIAKLDLAGLVCNKLGDHTCINPVKGQDGGDTWEYRSGFIDGMMKGREDTFGELRDKMGE